MKKLPVIFLLISLILATAYHCSKTDQEDPGQKTITFWHSFVASTIPALDELITRYERETPGVKIRAQYVPTGEALIQKLITAIQSQTAPDISWLHANYLEDLVQADAIYKMQEFINGPEGLTEEDLADIYPALIQYAKWRGTLYSFPMEATNVALLYNKDMFRAAGLDPDHPPQNWEELVAFAAKLTLDKDQNGKFDQIGFFVPVFPAAGPQGSWMVWQWKPYVWQAGGYFVDIEQTRALYDDEAAVRALELWKKLYVAQRLDVFTTDFDVAFASKHLAITMDGPWNLPRYRQILKNMNWGFAFLPAGPKKRATIVGGEYLAIFKQSKFPREAWRFIKWIAGSEIQAFWSMKSGYLPIRKSVSEVPVFKTYLEQHPNFKVFVDQMSFSQAERPIDYGGIEINRHIAEAIEKATVGKMDARQALKEAVHKSQQVLNQAQKAVR